MTLSATILEAQEFARRLTLKADGVVLAYDEVLGGFSWASATPATPVTTGTAAQRAAVSGSAGQLFHETDTSVLLQWTAVAAAWKAVAAPGAWTSASRPPVGTTDAAYEGLEVYEQDTGKVMVLRRTTLGSAISGGNPLIWTFVAPSITPGAGITLSGDGSPTTPFIPVAKNRAQLSNPIRNASFQVAQRGTSVVLGAAAGFTLDGWHGYRGGTVTGMSVSQQTTLADTQGSGYCARVQRVAADSSTTVLNFSQAIPTVDSRRWAGRTATISFRARCGANYSAASSVLPVYLITGTGTDQNYVGGITGQATAVTVSATLTTSFQTFSATVTLSGSLTQLAVVAIMTPTGTAGAADYFEIKDVRIDEGSYALEHVPLPYALDLADCQRLFWRLGGLLAYQELAPALCPSTTALYALVRFPVEMRAAPSATFATASLFAAYDGVTVTAGTAIALSGANTSLQEAQINLTVASGLTQYRPYFLLTNASTSGYIDFSAEI